MTRELLVAASAWTARILQSGVQLVVMHMFVRLLGAERYSVVVVLQSLVLWFALTEFGLGPAVQNLVSRGRSRGHSEAGLVAGALGLGCLGLLVSIAALVPLADPVGSWLLRRFELGPGTAGRLVLLVGFASAGAAIAGISYRILYATQKGYLTHAYQAGGSLVTLLWAVLLIRAGEPRLPLAVAAVTIPPALSAVAATVHVVAAEGWHWPKWEVLRELARDASGFVVFAVVASTVLQVDYIVMSQVLVARDIIEYTVLNRVFMLAFFVYNAALMALWPTVAECYHSRRLVEMRSYTKRYVAGGLSLIGVTTVGVLVAAPLITSVLAPGVGISLRPMIIVLFGFYICLRVWSDTFSMLLQSADRVRPLVGIVLLQGVLSVGLQFILASRLGVTGIVLGLALSFCLTSAWFGPYQYGVMLRADRRTAG